MSTFFLVVKIHMSWTPLPCDNGEPSVHKVEKRSNLEYLMIELEVATRACSDSRFLGYFYQTRRTQICSYRSRSEQLASPLIPITINVDTYDIKELVLSSIGQV